MKREWPSLGLPPPPPPFLSGSSPTLPLTLGEMWDLKPARQSAWDGPDGAGGDDGDGDAGKGTGKGRRQAVVSGEVELAVGHRYKIKRFLGAGTYGAVFSGQWGVTWVRGGREGGGGGARGGGHGGGMVEGRP